MFWQRGSVIATAFTPIVVAIVAEVLQEARRRDHVGHAARDPPQRHRRGGALRAADGRRIARRGPGAGQPLGHRGRPVRPAPAAAPQRRRFPWKLARHHRPGRRRDRRRRRHRLRAGDLRPPGRQLQALDRPARRLARAQQHATRRRTTTPTPTATEEPTATATATAEPTATADPDRKSHADPVGRATAGHTDADRAAHRGHTRPHGHALANGQGPDPDRADHADRPRVEPGRRPGGAPARHARDQPRALRGGQERRARAPPRRGRRADRDRARDDEGRGDEARAGDELPRRRARAGGAPRGVPAQARRAPRRRAQGALQRHAQGDRDRARRAAQADVRGVRPRADRRRLDRPGLPRATARRPHRRGQGPVPRRRAPRSGRTCRTSGSSCG